MRYELYKIVNREHLDDLINGILYMNTLQYFRGMEKNAAQKDCLEGVCGSVPKDRLKQYGFYVEEALSTAVKGNVPLISSYYGMNHLFCLYKLNIDDECRVVERPSEKLRQFNDKETEDKVVVRIRDTPRFLRLVSDAVERGLRQGELEYGISGSVTYSSAWINADGPGTRSAFDKEPRFSYQKEWRLCLLLKELSRKAYKFSIGDLSDIVEVISLDEFLLHPEKPYPGYAVSAEPMEGPQEPFRIFGTADAVNHLMFSYTAPSGSAPSRSDRAQADWHYAKYLQLCGKTGEVDSYLDKRMRECRDLEHLELLTQHRLSCGDWVRATDAYMFFIREAPETICEDPDRFFFTLHTILMQHGQAADAGKLYWIAEKQYGLSSPVKETIENDILFALGLFDQVIPHLLELKSSSNDPILDYYLAVAYLHTLDFTTAHHYLSAYETYFSHSPETAEKRTYLRKIVDVFRKQTPLPIERQRHSLEELPRDTRLEQLLRTEKVRTLFFGIDSLYRLQREDLWPLAEKFSEISACPMTIAEIINLYMQTGDETLFRLVIRLSELPQLRIQSPELMYYLAMDLADEDMPAFMKMERALYLQETQQSERSNEEIKQ